MPIQGFNFGAVPIVQPREHVKSSGIGDLLQGLLQGQGFAHNIQEQQRAREQHEFRKKAEALKHELDQKYSERERKAEIAEKEAKTKYYKIGGGRGGVTPEIVRLQNSLQEAEEIHGKDSPQAEQIRQTILKKTTDSDTRKRNLYASNLVQSIESANVDDLVRYSGPKGQIEMRKEQAKDILGFPSEEYIKHKEAQKAVALEAQELRQFLGTSITPKMDQALREMVDATSLTTSPQTAKRMIEKSRGIIKKQLGTYQKALKTTKAYGNEDLSNEAENEYISQSLKNATIPMMKNGQIAHIPANEVEQAKQYGWALNE